MDCFVWDTPIACGISCQLPSCLCNRIFHIGVQFLEAGVGTKDNIQIQRVQTTVMPTSANILSWITIIYKTRQLTHKEKIGISAGTIHLHRFQYYLKLFCNSFPATGWNFFLSYYSYQREIIHIFTIVIVWILRWNTSRSIVLNCRTVLNQCRDNHWSHNPFCALLLECSISQTSWSSWLMLHRSEGLLIVARCLTGASTKFNFHRNFRRTSPKRVNPSW